jgi:hypothetical protein
MDLKDVKERLTKNQKENLSKSATPAIRSYDKKRGPSWEIQYKESPHAEPEPMTVYNTYTPPLCATLTNEDDVDWETRPKDWERLCLHLFKGNRRNMDYMETILHDMIHGRSPVVTCFIGDMQVGKNTLLDVAKCLNHVTDRTTVNVGFGTTHFDGATLSKGFVHLDEIDLNKKAMQNLRMYTGTEFETVKKNKDPALITGRTTFFYSANPVAYVYLQCPDRRFWMPDLTRDALETSFTEEQLERFKNYKKKEIGTDMTLGDDNMQAHLYYYLRNLTPKYKLKNSPEVTETFRSVARRNFDDGMTYIAEYCKQAQKGEAHLTIEWDKLVEGFPARKNKAWLMDYDRLERFLKGTTICGFKFGRLVEDEEGKKFLEVHEEEEEEDFLDFI